MSVLIERNDQREERDENVEVQGQSRKEIDQARAIQLQKAAFNAQVAKKTDEAIDNYKSGDHLQLIMILVGIINYNAYDLV